MAITGKLSNYLPSFLTGKSESQSPIIDAVPDNVTNKSDSITVSDSAKESLLSLPPSTFIMSGTPVWRNFSELIYLLRCYYENPVVNAVINIKSKAFSNMKFVIRDLKDGEEIPLEKYDRDKGILKQLMKKPNPMQNGAEWLRQLKVNYEVFGNGFVYGSVPVGWEKKFNYMDVVVMNNLPPYCITPVLTGNWLSATSKEEIISEYVLSDFNGKKKPLNTNTVLHFNNTNIQFDQNFTQGKSDLLALTRPISNIDKAFESRNVLITKRGALGAWTSEKKDEAMGHIPLTDKEIEAIQQEFAKYGLLDDQHSHIISPMPLKYQKTSMSVKELMLFEEIEADAIAIANAKGVPELLVKYYIKGGTFENLNASERRLYDSTIIPEAEDFMSNMNDWLYTEELGIEIMPSFDHLNILQENKKDESVVTKNNTDSAEKAFRTGAINYNTYLGMMGLPHDSEIGEKRIWDLDENQLKAIGKSINTSSNGKQGEQTGEGDE